VIVDPISAFVPVAPDADWEAIRGQIAADVAASAPQWTDHNPSDPGITLAEGIAASLADGHYRVAETMFGAWPLASHGYLDQNERHWHAVLPQGADLGALAEALAALPGDAERAVRAAASRPDAVAAIAGGLASAPVAVRADVVTVLRSRLVRQLALEHADIIGDAVAGADAAGTAATTLAERDALATARLALALPLWDEELAALVRRERGMLAGETMTASAPRIVAVATAQDATDVVQSLEEHGLTAEQAELSLALSPLPATLLPEDLEREGGATKVWPPHGIQALTCEPVTALDYARRARSHPQVGRAWAMPGRLGGVAWHGLPVLDPDDLGAADPHMAWAKDPAAAAVTVVVDRVNGADGEPDLAADQTFLRAVLAIAVSSEVYSPFPTWRDDMDPLDPRRVVCDEVGATLLRRLGVTLRATLIVAVTADSAVLKANVRSAVATFFAQGRPESRTALAAMDVVDGPWPPTPQPALGWNPGEAIRFTEVVERIVSAPDVLGVEDLWLQLDGYAEVPASAGQVVLPKDAIPVLAEHDCLTVNYAKQGGCADA